MLDRTNRALIVTVLFLAALLLLRFGQQAMVDPPGFAAPGFEAAELRAVSVCSPSECAGFARGDSGRWEFEDGSDVPVDQGKVNELARAWSGGVATEYKVATEVSGHVSGAFGTLGDGTITVRFGQGSADELLSLEVGGEAPDGGRFVQRMGDRAVYVMQVPRPDLLRAEASAWVDRRELARGARELDGFGIEGSHGSIGFAREGEDWRVTEPEGLAADPRAVERLLDQVAVLPSLPRWDGDRPEAGGRSISAWTRSGETAQRCVLTSSGGAGVAVDCGGGELLRADRVVWERLDVSPAQIADRALLHWSPERGSALEWRRGARAVQLRLEDRWLGPTGNAPQELALALAALQPLRSLGPSDAPSGEPVAKLLLSGPHGESLMKVWPEQDGGVPVTLDGRPALLAPRVIARLDALLPP